MKEGLVMRKLNRFITSMMAAMLLLAAVLTINTVQVNAKDITIEENLKPGQIIISAPFFTAILICSNISLSVSLAGL